MRDERYLNIIEHLSKLNWQELTTFFYLADFKHYNETGRQITDLVYIPNYRGPLAYNIELYRLKSASALTFRELRILMASGSKLQLEEKHRKSEFTIVLDGTGVDEEYIHEMHLDQWFMEQAFSAKPALGE